MSDTVEVGATRIELKGLSKTVRSLERLGVEAADLRTLMHHLGTTVASTAQQLVQHKTGTLASTIRPGRGKTKAVIRAGNSRVPYAGVQHYGWPAHHIAPTLFLADAIRRNQSRILADLDSGLQHLIERTQQ